MLGITSTSASAVMGMHVSSEPVEDGRGWNEEYSSHWRSKKDNHSRSEITRKVKVKASLF